jgi:hypothetical protein
VSGPTPPELAQPGVGLCGQGVQLGAQQVHVSGQGLVLAGQDPQCGPGRGEHVGGVVPGPEPGRSGGLLWQGQGGQLEVQAFRCGEHEVPDLGADPDAGSTRGLQRDPQHPDRLDDSVAGLGHHGGVPGQHSPGGRLGVDGVTLAAGAAQLPVGPVHLDHRQAGVLQDPLQAQPVGPGALNTDLGHGSCPVIHRSMPRRPIGVVG